MIVSAPVVFRLFVFFILLIGVGVFIRIVHVTTGFYAFCTFYMDEPTFSINAKFES